MNRDSRQYQRNKLAFELEISPQWRDLLKPMLETKIKREHRKLTNLDDALDYNYRMGQADEAQSIINLVERYAKAHKEQ